MHGFKRLSALGVAALATSLVAPQAAQAGQGLNGAYWVFNIGLGSTVASAEAKINGVTPDVTFTANTLCFQLCGSPVSDGISVNSFLGANATNISANSIIRLSDHVMTLTGYLVLPSTTTYSFSLGSDDGSRLWIDGATVLDNDGSHAFSTVSGSTALSAGVHRIRVLQFENGDVTGLTVMMSGKPLSGSVLQTVRPGPVPEPASWALMIGGFAAAGSMMRRRARAVATI